MAKPLAVLRFRDNVQEPSPAKLGDYLVIYADRCEIVSRACANHSEWLRQWKAGRIEAVSNEDSHAMDELHRRSKHRPALTLLR